MNHRSFILASVLTVCVIAFCIPVRAKAYSIIKLHDDILDGDDIEQEEYYDTYTTDQEHDNQVDDQVDEEEEDIDNDSSPQDDTGGQVSDEDTGAFEWEDTYQEEEEDINDEEEEETESNTNESPGGQNQDNVFNDQKLDNIHADLQTVDDDLKTIDSNIVLLIDAVKKCTLSIWACCGLYMGTKLIRGLFND